MQFVDVLVVDNLGPSVFMDMVQIDESTRVGVTVGCLINSSRGKFHRFI